MNADWLGSGLIANVNPAFSWARLAQRTPVRIAIDDVPNNVTLRDGMTATAVVIGPNDSSRIKPPAR